MAATYSWSGVQSGGGGVQGEQIGAGYCSYTINGIAAGDYKFTVKIAALEGSCATNQEGTITVTAVARPVPQVTAKSNVVCEGSGLTFTATETTSLSPVVYSWTGSKGDQAGGTDYTVSGSVTG